MDVTINYAGASAFHINGLLTQFFGEHSITIKTSSCPRSMRFSIDGATTKQIISALRDSPNYIPQPRTINFGLEEQLFIGFLPPTN